jgi:hypothetical protein
MKKGKENLLHTNGTTDLKVIGSQMTRKAAAVKQHQGMMKMWPMVMQL